MSRPEFFKTLTDLEPHGLSQKSFGGKAKIWAGVDKNGDYECLISYQAQVARADLVLYNLSVNFPVKWSAATTVRHFRSFAQYLADQCGFDNLPEKLEKIKKQRKFKSWRVFLSNLVEINIMFNTYRLVGEAYSRGI